MTALSLPPVPPLSADELLERQARALAEMRRRDLRGLIVWGRGSYAQDRNTDITYLTNWHPAGPCLPPTFGRHVGDSGHAALIVTPDGRFILFTDDDPAYSPGHLIQADEVEVFTSRSLVDGLCGAAEKFFGSFGAPIMLLGADAMQWTVWDRLAQAVGQGRLFEDYMFGADLRAVKTPREQVLLRRASKVGDIAVDLVMGGIAPGRTDAEVSAPGYAAAARFGARPYLFGILSNPASTYTHTQPSPWDGRRPMEDGNLVRVDFAGNVEGYMLDVARNRVVGDTPSDLQRMMTRAACDAVWAGVCAVRAGVTFGDVGRACQASLASSALLAERPEIKIPNWWGHTIGLRAEGPRVMADSDRPLETGMAFAIEQGLRIPGIGLASYEELVIVTPEGYELLTHAKNWMIEVGG